MTSDAIADPDTKLESTARVYLVNGLAVAVEIIEDSGSDYAVVTDSDCSGTLGSKLSGWKATILAADGTEETYTLHKDSKKDGTNALDAASNELDVGEVIEYSISNGQLKVKREIAPFEINDGTQLWDEDTKKFVVDSSSTEKVADSGAVLFVQKLKADGTLTETFSVHTLRDLGDFTANKVGSNPDTKAKVVAVVKDGLVKAAFVTLKTTPGGVSADTKYGIVTAYNGTHVVGKNTYTQYSIAVGDGEVINANIDNTTKDSVIQKGDIVIFDETSDNVYDENSFQILKVQANGIVNVAATTGAAGTANASWKVGAVKEFLNNTTLKYGNETTYDAGDKIYKITADANIITETVKSDATMVYVDRENTAYGVDTGIVGFNVNSGKENILFHVNDKGIIDIVIVETNDKGFGATGKFAQR